MSKKNTEKVVVRTGDRDVLVLLLVYSLHMNEIGESEIYTLGGCDTVSSVYGSSKVFWGDSLNTQTNKEKIVRVFHLSNEPKEVIDQQMDALETFVHRVYYLQN